jgi:hypothetical protein
MTANRSNRHTGLISELFVNSSVSVRGYFEIGIAVPVASFSCGKQESKTGRKERNQNEAILFVQFVWSNRSFVEVKKFLRA